MEQDELAAVEVVVDGVEVGKSHDGTVLPIFAGMSAASVERNVGSTPGFGPYKLVIVTGRSELFPTVRMKYPLPSRYFLTPADIIVLVGTDFKIR
jgi:hypothetical protein